MNLYQFERAQRNLHTIMALLGVVLHVPTLFIQELVCGRKCVFTQQFPVQD